MLLQMKYKGDYWPKPQAFVEAIREAKKEQIIRLPVPALPKPQNEARYGNEIDDVMEKIFEGSRHAIEILNEGLISYLYDDVCFREINGPQDVDSRYKERCLIKVSKAEERVKNLPEEWRLRCERPFKERRDNLTKKWRAIIGNKHDE